MRIREWLDTQVEVAAAKLDTDPTRETQIQANQALLAAVIDVVKLIDERIEVIERRLDIQPPDVGTKADRI